MIDVQIDRSYKLLFELFKVKICHKWLSRILCLNCYRNGLRTNLGVWLYEMLCIYVLFCYKEGMRSFYMCNFGTRNTRLELWESYDWISWNSGKLKLWFLIRISFCMACKWIVFEFLDSAFNSLQFGHKLCMIRGRNGFEKCIWSW